MTDYCIPVTVFCLFCTLFICFRTYRWLGLRLWLPLFWLPALALAAWPPLYPYLEAYPIPREIYAMAGSAWMTLALAGLALFILLDILRLLVWFYYRGLDGKGFDFLPPRRSVPLALLLLVCFGCYGAYEAKDVRVTQFGLQTDKLPQNIAQLRLVFVSDIHLQRLTSLGDLQRLMELVKAQNGDILLFGGDIVSADLRGGSKEAYQLASAMPGGGSFGVLGEHEALFDHRANAIPFFSGSWVRVMRGEALAVRGIALVGVDDPAVAEAQGTPAHDPMLILESLPRERFTVLLKHQPSVQPESLGLFDLQLSGHSLGGQIWPMKYLAGRFFGVPLGRLVQLSGENGKSWFYASNGAGFYRLPLRFMTPPEIVVVDLIK